MKFQSEKTKSKNCVSDSSDILFWSVT